MYSSLQFVAKYLNYYLTAYNGKGHGMHSPFVFDFIAKVMNDKTNYPEYDRVESLRKKLLKNNTILEVKDFGAGSNVDKEKRRTISSIAKNAAKSKKYAQLLFRIVRYYHPETIIELGTSLGITAAYFSFARPEARLVTMEGSKEVSGVAKQNFKTLGLPNVELIEGNFDDTLLAVVRENSSVDFAFIDGNHRQEPTERYFKQLLSKAHNNSIFIFDDIHWSQEMEAAWKKIKKHESVRCSIDLFFIGIIFFRKEFKERQHFTIRF